MKMSMYTNVVENRGDYLLHNTLHNTMIKVHGDAVKRTIDTMVRGEPFAFDHRDALHKALNQLRMIVDEEADERAILDERLAAQEKGWLRLSMIVTRSCNFGCPYCLQNGLLEGHESGKHMPWKVYEDCLEAIVNRVKEQHCTRVSISWFGGEPSLEHDHICRFLHMLRRRLPESVRLTGQMTSNGYLLDHRRFTELVAAGVGAYHITVDGPQHIHDASRFLVQGGGTWQTIMDNLTSWKRVDLPFSVMIRTNFGEALLPESEAWLDYIAEHFGDDKRFFVHAIPIMSSEREGLPVDFGFEEGLDLVGQMILKARERGLDSSFYKASLALRGMACHAGSDNALVVDCDGTLKKCDQVLDREDNVVGHIEAGKFVVDEAQLSDWTHYTLPHTCEACSIYPLCLGKICAAARGKSTVCEFAKGQYNRIVKNTYLVSANSQ